MKRPFIVRYYGESRAFEIIVRAASEEDAVRQVRETLKGPVAVVAVAEGFRLLP